MIYRIDLLPNGSKRPEDREKKYVTKMRRGWFGVVWCGVMQFIKKGK